MQDNNNTTGMPTSASGMVLSELDAVKLGIDICEALEPYARAGQVHKGVHPDNIFQGWSGEYVLGAPAADTGDAAFTAPEIVRGEAFDTRADIYSLGMLLEYVLGSNASASDDLNGIIRIACAPDPSKRFVNVYAMKNALMNLHASKYFNGVKVSIADEVTAQTGGVASVRKDIQNTEQDEEKRRIAEDNAKRQAAFTAPWDDTVVVSVPGYGVTVGFDTQTGAYETLADTRTVDRSDLHDMADHLLDEMSDRPRTQHIPSTTEEIRRSDAINSAKAVTDAQRIAYENKQKKKNMERSMGTGKSKTVAVTLIIAIAALLLVGCIIAGVVLIGRLGSLGPGGQDTVIVPQSLVVLRMPDKVSYYPGEEISMEGLALEARYEDGTAEEVTDGFTFTPDTAEGLGGVSVTVYYNGAEVTFGITVTQREAKSLYLEELPTRREFAIGEELDLSGMVIDVLFVDGSHEMMSEGYTFEPLSFTELGEQKVTVTYGEKSVSFVVNIVDAVVNSLSVISEPQRLDYYVGEAFDTTGLVLLAEYPSGNEGEVSAGFTVSPEKFTATGKQTVTVTYGTKSVEFEVNVSRANLTRLAVRSMPSKTTYTVGESLSMKGFSMWAYYDNGTSQIITNSYTYSPATPMKTGTQYITVSYMGKTTGFYVTVNAAAPKVTATGVSVKTMPNKTDYMVGDKLDTTGLSLTVKYSDGSTKTVTSGFTCSPTTLSSAGKVTVSVMSDTGYSTSFTVNVSAPVSASGKCGAKATWTLSGGTLTISGSGDIDSFAENDAPWSSYSTKISTVNVESGITSIGAYAFANTTVKTLNISETVRRIEKSFIYNCTSLSSINVSSSSRYYISENGHLLSRDKTTLYALALGGLSGTYTMPDSVKIVDGFRMFFGSSIREIVIGKDLYSIDSTTFIGARKLEKFTVNSRNVALIAEDGVLYTKNKNALVCYPTAKGGSAYTVPEGVTVIREGAFAYNASLKELTLPATLNRVDANAFYGASKFSSVTFMGSESAWVNVTKGTGNGALLESPIKYGG